MFRAQYAAIAFPAALLVSCSSESVNNVTEREHAGTITSPCVTESGALSRIGDVNNDGNIDTTDVSDISSFLERKHVKPFNRVVADVNRDGVITDRDRMLIHGYVSGKRATFPVEDVNVLLSQMTLKEKVGQLILVEQQAIFIDEFRAPVEEGGVGWTWLPDREVDLEDVKDYGFGAFFSGGDSVPYKVQRMYNGNDEFDVDKVPGYFHEMYRAVQAEALKSRLMIPVMYGVDTVHGYGGVRGATIFPHNIGIGATRDEQLVRRVGAAVAEEATNCAVDWVFSPAVSVVDDVRWGRTYEGFSENTDLVSEMTVAYVDGFQGSRFGRKDRVLATAKHFLGDGGVKFGTGIRTKQNVRSFTGQEWGIYADSWGDSYATLGNGGFFLDQGDTQCTEEELRSRHLPPYRAAIRRTKQEVASIMVSHSSWNGVKSHENYHLITEALKGELGFSGLVVSDWESPSQNDASYLDNPYHRNNVDQLNTNLNEFTDAELRDSINAGLDMLMLPSLWTSWSVVDRTVDGVAVPGIVSRIIDLVEQGEISESRIDDAARRVLLAKQRRGLFDDPMPETPTQTVLGSPEHRQLAREAVRKSTVLLKNKHHVLPIA